MNDAEKLKNLKTYFGNQILRLEDKYNADCELVFDTFKQHYKDAFGKDFEGDLKDIY